MQLFCNLAAVENSQS
ncbi:hypothetical protein LINPERHAP1_LOCUS24755 [Linum perenne]